MEVPLAAPDITAAEIEAVMEVLKGSQLALGPRQEQFEREIAALAGRRHGVAVNSGTSGLHLLVRSLGIGAGDEVITSPFSFISSANCILFEGARPVFVDIDPDTLNIDTALIEAAVTPRTRAILPVHVFGQPPLMGVIREIASRYNLAVIEDACEAIGARRGGCAAGSSGDGAVFAFYPNKQITTGEGGMIVTDDDAMAALCRSMRNQGRGEGGGWFDHVRLGYNYRLDELSAALGLAQLKRLPEILAQRRRVSALYNSRLHDLAGVRLPHISADVEMSWFVYVIRLADGIDRDAVAAYLQACGVQCRPYFAPIHLQPFYRQLFGYRDGDFPVTEAAGRSALALPFHNRLGPDEVDYVALNLKKALESFS